MPGSWNDNNSTWTAFLPNSPSPTYMDIYLLTGPADPSKDTLASPAANVFYGTMGLTLPPLGSPETGLNVSMDPPTIPCDGCGVMVTAGGDEFILFWNRECLPFSLVYLQPTHFVVGGRIRRGSGNGGCSRGIEAKNPEAGRGLQLIVTSPST
ncbi:MAG: hypothetical protein LQ340_008016 [Diploschistes diacapsis]|nr:MAG: hypothetical protein LQ340_008016 [Diploschistes diacapsis]